MHSGHDRAGGDGVEVEAEEQKVELQYVPHAGAMSKGASFTGRTESDEQIALSLATVKDQPNYLQSTGKGKYFSALHLLCDLTDFQFEREGFRPKDRGERFFGRLLRPMAGIEHVGVIRQVLREHMQARPGIFVKKGIAVAPGTEVHGDPIMQLDYLMRGLITKLGKETSGITKNGWSLTWDVLNHISSNFCENAHERVLNALKEKPDIWARAAAVVGQAK
jgi:hypothetical protein